MASSLHESLQEKIFTLMYPTNSTQGPFQGQNQNPFQRQGEVDERDLFVSPISPKSVPTWNKSMSNSASIFQRRSPTISVSNYSTRPSTALPAAEESHQSHDGVRFGKVEWSPQQDNAAFKSPPAAPNMSDIISSDQFQDRDGLEKSGLGIHIVKGERKEHDSTGSQSTSRTWEPTVPPVQFYQTETRDEWPDVEIRTYEKQEMQVKKRRTCTENKVRTLMWGVVLVIPFIVLPLVIFGGVYHWGTPQGLCKAGGGTWIAAQDECQYS